MKKRVLVFIWISCMVFIAIVATEKRKIVFSQSCLKPIKELSTYQQEENNGKKMIYLTFDDGPSKGITEKVLDILKEKQVTATFFLIGNQIDGLEPVVKRMVEEGHSIGLHTYTHKFKRIYANREIFIKEMEQCGEKIKEVVGREPKIIRFPGGSRKRLTKTYLEKLHGHQYKVYDWNMESVDGLNPKVSSERIYRDATKGSEELSTIILLLHCDYMHNNTTKALPKIIDYYKEKGYEFKTITEDTPELYSPISK